MNQSYELLLLTRADLDEKTRTGLIDNIKSQIEKEKGEVKEEEAIGKKELAFEVDKTHQGFYNLLTFTAEASVPNSIVSKLKIEDDVLRYIIVKKERPN
jgi:small subunit ribosomal protein S6